MHRILAAHINSYHTYPLRDALAGIARAGFRYVELAATQGWATPVPLATTAAEVAEVQALLQQHGLQAASLSGHSDLTTPEGLQQGLRAVDLCAQLGLTIMNTAIGGHYKEHEDKAAFMRQIFELADYAAARGVLIALEVHGEIMATGRLAVPLINEINRANVRINYDTANCVFYGGVDPLDDLPGVVPYLAHVHLKDTAGGLRSWNFPAIGAGRLDFGAILGILDAAGYAGPLSVEIEFQGEPWPPLAEVDRAMQASYQHLRNLAGWLYSGAQQPCPLQGLFDR